jgi:hypothetical protein
VLPGVLEALVVERLLLDLGTLVAGLHRAEQAAGSVTRELPIRTAW